MDTKRIDKTTLPNGRVVSTVYFGFAGIDYESMCFPPDSRLDLECVRTRTLEEAEIAHDYLCEKWWDARDPRGPCECASPSRDFLCTLPEGHDGPHKAHSLIDPRPLAVWGPGLGG